MRAPTRILAALLVPAALQVPAGEVPSARELLALTARAYAPGEAEAPRTLVVRGRAQLAEGGLTAVGTWTEVHRAGVGTRITLAVEGLGTFEEGAAPGVVWERHPSAGPRRLDGFDADAALRRFAWYRGSGWSDAYRELRDPRRAGDGRASLSLVAAFRRCEHVPDFEGREVVDTLTVDLASGLPSELVLVEHARSGRTVERVVELDGWRALDGRAWPMRRTERFAGRTIELAIESVETGPELDATLADAELAPPADLPAPAPELPPDPETVRVRTLVETPTAVLRVRCAPADARRGITAALGRLPDALAERGAVAAGPPFVRRLVEGDDEVEVEVGVPLAEPLADPDEGEGGGERPRLVPSTLPAGDVASVWHLGSRVTLDATRARLERWIDEQGLARRGPAWDVHWTDPAREPDEARWRLEILRPVERGR